MKVRAVAAASQDSTAVGSIELECAPHGLLMRYLGVGAYSNGYAPGAVTSGTRCAAPWPDVLEVRTTDDAVLLSINPSLTPHHKLCLKNFSQGDVDERELARRRKLLRFAVAMMTLACGLSIGASMVVWAPASGQGAAFGVGLLAALVVLVSGLAAEKLWLPPPPDSAALQRRLLAEIQHYRPAPVLPAMTRSVEAPRLVDLLLLLPRSTTAIVIVLSAGSLAAVLTSSWILDGSSDAARVAHRDVEPPARETEPGLVNPTPVSQPAATTATTAEPPRALPEAPASHADTATQGAACQCERPDSVLWRLPFPRLSTLLISERLRSHNEHHHVELELAVVNNGNKPLKEISLMVQFFENEGKEPTKDRPLYYESWLNPGEAIKWRVEARGSSFIVNNPLAEVLMPGSLASADDFAELLNANHRPVRLHGAMMLAYLDDPRAKEGATKLREALRDEEGPYLDRVLWARRGVVPCDTRATRSDAGHHVELCIFNRGTESQSNLGVKVRGLDRDFDFRSPVAEPPIVVAERIFRLPGDWPAGEGRWVAVEMEQSPVAERKVHTFEALIDAHDLLH